MNTDTAGRTASRKQTRKESFSVMRTFSYATNKVANHNGISSVSIRVYPWFNKAQASPKGRTLPNCLGYTLSIHGSCAACL